MAEIYDFATGKISINQLSDQTRAYMKNWIEKVLEDQMKAPDGKQMNYKDIMGWLAKYIEDQYRDANGNVIIPNELKEWKASTMSTEYGADGVVRIIIEDEEGTPIDIPEPPVAPPDEENLLMKVAGTVFLDQRETKNDAKESNGKLDQGETLLKGIEVTLYEADTNQVAKLIESDKGELRHNPTVTDMNGYYEFNGVDAMKKYYVEFKYNGMQYRTTSEGTEAKYNTDEWAVTSKANQEGGAPEQFKTITADTKAYHYDEIAGLYAEIADLALNHIYNNPGELNIEAIRNQVAARHSSDPEINDKIQYMREIEVKAYAGYSSSGSKAQTYPHKSLGNNFIINGLSMGSGKTEIDFAGETVKLLYPGQLQIHCGLVERASVDLSLTSDIVDTVVSINKYDTKYDYYKGESNYHQYIYEEDYAYREEKDAKEDGIAYYTEDNVHFYITYEIVLTNETNLGSKVLEVVDYYNKEFKFDPNGYTTTKGTKIPAITSYVGDTLPEGGEGQNPLGVTIQNSSRYANAKGGKDGYKELYIGLNQNIAEGLSNSHKVRLTFELVGDTNGNEANAKEVLKKYLYQEDQKDGNGYARSWIIGNYAEINAYATDEVYLDRDSRPGNFMIQKFEDYNAKFTEAFVKYILGGGESASREMNMWLNRMKELQEDDAWYVGISLTNNGFIREITGNVWEAIVKDKVESSLDLNKEYKAGDGEDGILTYPDGSRILNYQEALDEKQKLEGIKVELVELLKKGDKEKDSDATQIVRAVTETDGNGEYTFKSYIAGDYAVRFVYGGEGTTPESKVTKNTKEDGSGDFRPINGQYYQSTKANPTTDTTKYWYKEWDYDENGKEQKDVDNKDLLNRYSDAYDDAYSRRSQMLSNVSEKVTNDKQQTSSDYDYEGVISVESQWHNDPIYAYTSTMELEIEYIRPQILGNSENGWYEYKVNNIDFGVTPRAYNDVSITKYVSNIKLYNQDKNGLDKEKLEVDAYYDRDGNRVNEDGSDYTFSESDVVGDIKLPEDINNRFQDGYFDIQYEPELLQNARLEITYQVIVENNSLHDGGIYDKIKYIYEGGKVIAVVYYEEETEKMVYFEGNDGKQDGKESLRDNVIVYHNSNDAGEYSNECLDNEKDKRKEKSGRLSKYQEIKGFNDTEASKIITSKVTNIVDFVNKPLEFTQPIDKDGKKVNANWDMTTTDKYVSSRENYSVSDGKVSYQQNGNLTDAYNSIRYNKEGQDGLYAELLPGEDRQDELKLVLNLGTQSAGTNEYQYPNEIEITRLENSAGKIVDIEGYLMDRKETSEVRNLEELEYPGDYNGQFTPSISTSRSGTVTITVPAGLTLVDNVVGSNLGIVLVVLVIFAVGLVLIKKFVLVPKK